MQQIQSAVAWVKHGPQGSFALEMGVMMSMVPGVLLCSSGMMVSVAPLLQRGSTLCLSSPLPAVAATGSSSTRRIHTARNCHLQYFKHTFI